MLSPELERKKSRNLPRKELSKGESISVNIGCWNVQYFKTAQLYFCSVTDNFDILTVSENSLFAEQLQMPKNVTNGSTEIYGVSAHDNSSILSGQIAHWSMASVCRTV